MQRLRRWVGEHPVTATTLWSGAALALFAATFLLFVNPRSDDWLLPATIVITPLLIAAGSGTVGYVLGRAGRRIGRLSRALWWTPVVAAAVVVFLQIVVANWPWPTVLFIVLALAAYVATGQLLGWGAAALLLAWQRRRTTWEHIEPVGIYAHERTAGQWFAARPLPAATLLALSCVIGQFAFVCLLELLSILWLPDWSIAVVGPLLAAGLAVLIFHITSAAARAGRRTVSVLGSVPLVAAAAFGLNFLLLSSVDRYWLVPIWGVSVTNALIFGGSVFLGWAAATVVARIRKRRS